MKRFRQWWPWIYSFLARTPPPRGGQETQSMTRPSVMSGQTERVTVRDAYDDGLYATCEVCGGDMHRVQIDADQRGIGAWMEYREHRRGSAEHQWRQAHNCVRPTSDDCPFCAAQNDHSVVSDE